MSILTPAEAVRLLREQWANPTMLAEELFSILTADLPDTLTAPVTIENGDNPDTPLFQLPNVQDGQMIFSVGPKGSLGDFTFTDGGIQFNPPEGKPPVVAGGGKPTAASASFPAIVQSGSGLSYQVQLITGKTVQATTWPQVADDQISAGSQVWVHLVDKTYYIQVPIWY